MKPIENRADVENLVNSFYVKIRQDELLGTIFNAHIPEEAWAAHLTNLADFWETNLFGVPRFKGNPTQKHIDVDRDLNHTITQLHFGRWLQLWFETIDELNIGEIAQRAKDAARKMSVKQFMAIWGKRPENR